MNSPKMLEKGLFELLDQLDGFIRMNALEALLVLLVLALIGGMWIIRVLGRPEKSPGHRTSELPSPGLGLLIQAPGRQPQHGDPPPLADPVARHRDDQRD
jgi:hypothetical protein